MLPVSKQRKRRPRLPWKKRTQSGAKTQAIRKRKEVHKEGKLSENNATSRKKERGNFMNLSNGRKKKTMFSRRLAPSTGGEIRR